MYIVHMQASEGSATKEISYTSWRNQLKSWEIKADFLEIKLGNQSNPPPHPLLQRMTSFLREITGKSKRSQEISYAKIARCRRLACLWIIVISTGMFSSNGHYLKDMYNIWLYSQAPTCLAFCHAVHSRRLDIWTSLRSQTRSLLAVGGEPGTLST